MEGDPTVQGFEDTREFPRYVSKRVSDVNPPDALPRRRKRWSPAAVTCCTSVTSALKVDESGGVERPRGLCTSLARSRPSRQPSSQNYHGKRRRVAGVAGARFGCCSQPETTQHALEHYRIRPLAHNWAERSQIGSNRLTGMTSNTRRPASGSNFW